jgi:hypothetical protein
MNLCMPGCRDVGEICIRNWITRSYICGTGKVLIWSASVWKCSAKLVSLLHVCVYKWRGYLFASAKFYLPQPAACFIIHAVAGYQSWVHFDPPASAHTTDTDGKSALSVHIHSLIFIPMLQKFCDAKVILRYHIYKAHGWAVPTARHILFVGL